MAGDIGTKRMMAFLALLRAIENKGVNGSQVYHRFFGGGFFMKMSDHPRKKHRRWGQVSTGAGAYQILEDTYDTARRRGVVHDFSPQSQDKIAVWLIQQHCAASYISNGDFHSAYALLKGTWSSLPGGKGQEIDGKGADDFIRDQLDTEN